MTAMASVSTFMSDRSLSGVEAVVLSLSEPGHLAFDFGPAKFGILSANTPHGSAKQAFGDFIGEIEACTPPFLRCHRAGAEDFFPVDRVLKVLQGGGVIVRVRHAGSLTDGGEGCNSGGGVLILAKAGDLLTRFSGSQIGEDDLRRNLFFVTTVEK